ncbi:MAG: nitroreductase family deazaflavin-dependent oxidoreductase [Acidimicrobiales bacterium]
MSPWIAPSPFLIFPPRSKEALQHDLTIDITTTGRQSGEPRRIEIWFLAVDGQVYITGTPGPRHWLANLRANPRFTFHLKESAEADLPAIATEVDDPAERRMVIASMAAEWYRGQAPIEQLVAEAPMVRITFEQPPSPDRRA